MTGLERKAVQRVFELLEIVQGDLRDAKEILRQALAQPKQEPFEYWNAVEGWVKIDEVREHFDSVGCGTIYKSAGEGRSPLYTAPPNREWVGLTDEESQELLIKAAHHKDPEYCTAPEMAVEFGRLASELLKEKNGG